MIYIVQGDEPLFVDNKIAELTEGIDNIDINRSVFEEFTDDVLVSARQLPLMSKKRVIIYTGEIKKEHLKELMKYHANEVQSTVFILKSVKKNTKLYKEVKKCNRVYEMSGTKPIVYKYIEKWAESKQFLISQDMLTYFIERTGYFLNKDITMYNVMSYLDILVNIENTLSKENIDLVVKKTSSDNIFTLTDQIVKKDSVGALETFRSLKEAKMSDFQIVGAILYNFRTAYKISITPTEMVNSIGINPFVVSKLSSLTKNATEEMLEEIIALLVGHTDNIKCGKSVNMEHLLCNILSILTLG